MNLSTEVLKMLLSNWSEENLHSNLLKMNGVTIFSLSTHHLRAASTETVRRGRRIHSVQPWSKEKKVHANIR